MVVAVIVRDPRVAQRAEQLRLPLEARQPLRVGGERLRQQLERDVSGEPRVGGADTSPMPPAPSGATIRYGPTDSPAGRFCRGLASGQGFSAADSTRQRRRGRTRGSGGANDT
jgi:hypothetical protein